MIRRLGSAAFLAALIAPLLVPAEAMAQSRQKMPPRSELGTPPAPSLQQQEKTFPFGASWVVVTVNGKPAGDRRATLLVDQNLRGTGFAGCNTFSAAAYPLREQGFAVGPIALTKRACDKGLLDFERTYLTALRAAQKWDLVNGRLVLKGGAGEVQLSRTF